MVRRPERVVRPPAPQSPWSLGSQGTCSGYEDDARSPTQESEWFAANYQVELLLIVFYLNINFSGCRTHLKILRRIGPPKLKLWQLKSDKQILFGKIK